MSSNPRSVKSKNRPQRKKLEIACMPQYCDFTCPHASFAPNDVVGACRRELAVYCNLLARYNNKNSRCAARDARFGERTPNVTV